MPYHHFIKFKIDEYLRDELNPEDKLSFEKILAESPENREFFEDQKAAYELMRSGSIPEIDNQYWSQLENSIAIGINAGNSNSEELKAFEDEAHNNIWNVLIPLAASFLIFLAAVSYSTLPRLDGKTQILTSQSKNIEPGTSYIDLIETKEIIAISYMTTPAPGIMGL